MSPFRTEFEMCCMQFGMSVMVNVMLFLVSVISRCCCCLPTPMTLASGGGGEI